MRVLVINCIHNNSHNLLSAVQCRVRFHICAIGLTRSIQLVYPVNKHFRGQLLLRKNGRITLFANIFRIQDLIAAACAEGQRNKQRGNAEREKFKHGICTCAAYNKFGRCKQIRQLSADILILSVTRAVDAFIQLALPAKMNNIELLCKFRQVHELRRSMQPLRDFPP